VIRVAALTSGRNTPSSRFRVRQHIDALFSRGVNVKEFVPLIEKYRVLRRMPDGFRFAERFLDAGLSVTKLAVRVPAVVNSWRHDVTWMERELFSGRATMEGLLKKPIALDVDDAIWLSGPHAARGAEKIARQASVVLAGNRYIGEWFSQFCSDVRLVPTAIDPQRFRPANRPPGERRFAIGWTGLSSSYGFLYDIEKPLEQFLSVSDAQLVVIADKPPAFRTIAANRIQFIRWSPDVEADALHQFDVGIMPLPENEWSRGKCSLKMLQYMAAGLPVVVSPVGLNQEILEMGTIGMAARTADDWISALLELQHHPDLRIRLGCEGRRIVEQHFSVPVIADKLAAVFRSIV
jgi:glycosyltransferase involved in cell wall biosynthesis